MTSRLPEIKQWLSSLFPNQDFSTLAYIQADASSRKYLRLNINTTSYIIMETQPGTELNNFIKINQLLAAYHITVPDLIHINLEQGLLLTTDLGQTTYMQALQKATQRESQQQIDSLYMDALTTIIKMQQIPCADLNINQMDSLYINDRLQVFSTWYLQRHLGLELDSRMQDMLTKMQQLFQRTFTEFAPVFVHVDYHCRNLMLLPKNNPGVLDFQDAMIGPFTYDLVSLFQDAYVTWPRAQVESWLHAYKEMAVTAGIISDISHDALLRNFDLVGLQRHIKNLGIFARLHHRDQKSNYLNDIPTLLSYINATCTRYPDLAWLLEFIAEVVPG